MASLNSNYNTMIENPMETSDYAAGTFISVQPTHMTINAALS